MEKVLILGGKGNLGHQLFNEFSKDSKYEVISWDKSEIDVTDKDLILKKVSDIQPSVIINAAAYNAVDRCEDDAGFDLAKKINGLAPGYLAQAALQNGSVLIHYSTDYVFDGEREDGYSEDDKPTPISKYGESKLLGEKEIIKHSGKGLKWYLIRTSKLFGPSGDSDISKSSFFDTMVSLSEEKDELSVIHEEVSKFTYTPDLAKATRQLFEGDHGYGVYHIVNEGTCTWYEGVVELFRVLGIKTLVKPIKSEEYPRPAKRPAYSILINNKFPELRSWKDALGEYLNKK